MAMNKSDFDPFLKPKRLPASWANSSSIFSGTENSILPFLVGFSRGDVFKFEFVTSAAGGEPFPAFIFNLGKL